jgi:hypothetical protein
MTCSSCFRTWRRGRTIRTNSIGDTTPKRPAAMGAAGHRADLEAGELAVDFEGREVIYDVGELDELVQGKQTRRRWSKLGEWLGQRGASRLTG